MGFDLTNERIQDTYQQILQISGSTMVDGTGSAVTVDVTAVSASYAVTASFALNGGGGEWDEITGKPAGLVSGSSQVSYTGISDVPSGILSSSAQIADDISGSFTSTSASLASDIATKLDTSVYTTNSSSVSTRLTTNEGNISTQTSRVDSLVSVTSSYAVKSSNNTFTGTQTFDNIAVNGTGSFAYIQSVTGSAKIIGDAYIVLNNNTPAERYAGVKVYDSGSTNNSASFEFDGQTNDWFYEYTDDGGATEEFGVVMFGPGYNTRGSHVYPSNNTILKGTGDHHIVDSNISDDGTTVTVSTPLSASAVKLTSGGLTFSDGTTQTTLAQGGLVSGTGTDSMKSSDNLTTSNANAAGSQSIALGFGAQATQQRAIAIGESVNSTGAFSLGIGYDVNATQTYSIAIGRGADATGGSDAIALGRNANGGASRAISLGYNSSATGTDSIVLGTNNAASGQSAISIGNSSNASSDNGIAIGQGAQSTGNSVAIGQGATMGSSYGFAGGYNAKANNDASIAVGGDINVSSNQAIGIGTDVTIDASSQGAVSLGQNADISTSTRAVAIGQGSGATGANNGIAIGSGSKVTSANEINIGNKFKYDGTSTITLDASLIKVADSASATGSLIDNVHPAIASGSTAIKHIVTIDQTAYDTISGSGAVSDDTFYIISDAGDDVYPGNLQVSGQIYSPTFAGTIASSTSSISFDNGNFATLNCASSTFLANPTNLQGGTTYTLIVTNGANISGYGTVWKFAGGTEPTLSANTDVITAVSDGTSLYAAALADFS